MTPIDRLLAICSLPAGDDEMYFPTDLSLAPPPRFPLMYGDLRELAKLHQELIAENERLRDPSVSVRVRMKNQRRELRRLNNILRDRDEYRKPKEFLQYRSEKKFHKRTIALECWIVKHLQERGLTDYEAWKFIRDEFHERAT